MSLRVAASQYPVECLGGWDGYADKLEALVAEAAGTGARLLVFPEYGAMELVSLFTPAIQDCLERQLHALQGCLDDFLALHRRLARRHGVYILASSYPVAVGDGVFHNRAHLVGPGGPVGHQDKRHMTRFESERWCISPGRTLRTFDTPLGRLGVSICYDSEFPLVARAQVEAGADIILVPSCTDSLAGYHRVRIGCQARALENQCYVVHASTVGEAPWSRAVDVNVGAAAVYTPVDRGFPADGVLSVGTLNLPQWVYADLDPEAIHAVRETGQVFNHRDWPRQFDLPRVDVVEV